MSGTIRSDESGSSSSQSAYSMCMDDTNDQSTNGNKIQIYQCQFGDASQNWILEANGTLQHR
jgi:hypothetical protein